MNAAKINDHYDDGVALALYMPVSILGFLLTIDSSQSFSSTNGSQFEQVKLEQACRKCYQN